MSLIVFADNTLAIPVYEHTGFEVVQKVDLRGNEFIKMEIKFSDIELAFEYVSSAPMTSNTAVLCNKTGDIFYSSDYDEDEIPEAVYYRDDCIEIPHKNDLDLGKNLVFEFVDQYLSDDFERVRRIFKKRSAYARYKDLLERRGFLKKWYDFENTRQTETIRKWCEENGIMLVS